MSTGSARLSPRLPPVMLILVVVLSGAGILQASTVRITILHTGDEHGWLQPLLVETADGEVVWGGAAELMGQLRQLEGYAPDRDGYLLLSSGDMWTGPSISTWFEGESTVEVFNAMGYAAAAVGNHELDFGRDALTERAAQATFPLLSANLVLQGDYQPPGFATPYIVRSVHGIGVGIVGLSATTTAVTTHPGNLVGLELRDPEATLRRWVPVMRANGAEVVIVLAHECLDTLSDLAVAVEDLGIAVLAGGHCHELETRSVAGVYLMASGSSFLSYTRTDLDIDEDTRELVSVSRTIHSNESLVPTAVAPDASVAAIVDGWAVRAEEAVGRVIGYSETGVEQGSWAQANWVVDAWRWFYPAADVAITNWGSFRAGIRPGDITLGDVVGVLPFDNTLVECDITGAELLANLECCGGAISGLYISYSDRDGERVIEEATLADGRHLYRVALYRVLVNDFMYAGGGGYLLGLQDPDGHDTGISWRQPVIAWTEAQETSPELPIEQLLDRQPRSGPASRRWRRLGGRVSYLPGPSARDRVRVEGDSWRVPGDAADLGSSSAGAYLDASCQLPAVQ